MSRYNPEDSHLRVQFTGDSYEEEENQVGLMTEKSVLVIVISNLKAWASWSVPPPGFF
jgi:hypothetical protein